MIQVFLHSSELIDYSDFIEIERRLEDLKKAKGPGTTTSDTLRILSYKFRFIVQSFLKRRVSKLQLNPPEMHAISRLFPELNKIGRRIGNLTLLSRIKNQNSIHSYRTIIIDSMCISLRDIISTNSLEIGVVNRILEENHLVRIELLMYKTQSAYDEVVSLAPANSFLSFSPSVKNTSDHCFRIAKKNDQRSISIVSPDVIKCKALETTREEDSFVVITVLDFRYINE